MFIEHWPCTGISEMLGIVCRWKKPTTNSVASSGVNSHSVPFWLVPTQCFGLALVHLNPGASENRDCRLNLQNARVRTRSCYLLCSWIFADNNIEAWNRSHTGCCAVPSPPPTKNKTKNKNPTRVGYQKELFPGMMLSGLFRKKWGAETWLPNSFVTVTLSISITQVCRSMVSCGHDLGICVRALNKRESPGC